MHGAKRVIAIERDERCLAALAEIAAHYPGRLEIISGDALKTDFAALAPDGPAKIVANLPYNIGTELLVALADRAGMAALLRVDDADVPARGGRAHRRAAPASDAYGRLGVLAGWRTEAQDRLRRAAAGFHAAAQGDLVGRASRAPRQTPLRRRREASSAASPRRRSASAARCCGRA